MTAAAPVNPESTPAPLAAALDRDRPADLPERIAVGTSLTAYPALVAEGGDKRGSDLPFTQNWVKGRSDPLLTASATVAVRLFPTRAEAEASHRLGVRWLMMRKFAKELAFVRRYHKIPAELDRASLFFGGREAVESAIEEALARDVFERNIRAEADYRAYETEVGRTLFEKGHALTQTVVKIVELNAKLRAELGRGSGGGSAAKSAIPGKAGAKSLSLYELSKLKDRVKPEYLDAVAADLDRLVPKDFLAVYPIARLVRIPRYLEGLMIRLERARVDPEKDRAKSAQLERYAFELARLDRAPKSASPIPEDKRAAVDELRWMLEEFRLSLFGPEIKTAFPISAVRLARKIAEIDALV